MVHLFVSEAAVRLNSAGQVRIAAGKDDNIPVKRTFFNRADAVHARVEAIIIPQEF